jgi:site-specific recombinase XerD
MTDDYLLKERARIQGAKRTPYLIVSREGTPLTLSGLREVVEQITRRHQEFAGVLSPHVLRHTASDLWWAELQKTPLDVTASKEILNYLMGWSEDSTQGQKYPRGEIIRTAQDFALKAQAALFKPVESIAP